MDVRRLLCILAVALALVATARAAVLQLLYLDEMADKSPVIVHATIESGRSEWNAEHTTIHTVYTARSHQYLKGFLGETFEFREPGGRVGNVGVLASGAPQFREGEEVVLFLWTDGPSGVYQCIGFEQGVLRVSEADGIRYVNRRVPERNGAAQPASVRTAMTAGRATLAEALLRITAELGRAEAAGRKEAR